MLSDISNVIGVISELPSVPLNMISVSPPCASIVILPEVVVKFFDTSPAVKSSTLDTVSKDKVHQNRLFLETVLKNHRTVGNVSVKDDDILPAFKPT